ncbi:MAG TPA: aminoacyl-tRNA hydrolase, partial [Candidatus Paceibacterota bacterium]|nr:aminoacyl-tRNA hydrolase [Candidatus Paceibacterota bacterium]
MAWIIVGLGNPGYEYEGTRHNTGRMAVEDFAKYAKFSGWREDKNAKSLVSRGLVERTIVALVLPNTFMNKSG